MAARKKLILASASPRRREILSQLGVSYTIDPADIDESPLPGESAQAYVKRMATGKAAHVARRHCISQVSVLGADTTVVIDGDVLGKPVDHFDGLAMLARLSGREHIVMTAVCLQRAEGAVTRLVQTRVQFVQLVRAQCEAYLATDEPWDKAGGYAIQGRGGAFVRAINGSYSNVVGLPMSETWELLSGNGIATGLENSSE